MNEAVPGIAVVGSINVDLTARTARLPGPGETVGDGILERGPGGKGANQAVAAARLGARVRMIGAVGDDADGGWMLDTMCQAGVDCDGVRRVAAPTGTALIVVDAAGENQIAVCAGANGLVDIDSVDFADDDAVLVQLEVGVELATRLSRVVGGFFVLNAAPALPLPSALVDRADLIIVNETEFELLPEIHDARRVAVTYGARGAALFERGVEVLRVPAVPTEAVNSVGAGDAFCAALALAFARGSDPERALRTACAVGAAAVADPSSQPALEPIAAYEPRQETSA